MLCRNFHGPSILTDICQNEVAHPEWLESVINSSDGDEVDINNLVSPRTAAWRGIYILFRTILRLRISRSDLVMQMAHSEHATGVLRRVEMLLSPSHNEVVSYHSPSLGRRERQPQLRALALAQRGP